MQDRIKACGDHWFFCGFFSAAKCRNEARPELYNLNNNYMYFVDELSDLEVVAIDEQECDCEYCKTNKNHYTIHKKREKNFWVIERSRKRHRLLIFLRNGLEREIQPTSRHCCISGSTCIQSLYTYMFIVMFHVHFLLF